MKLSARCVAALTLIACLLPQAALRGASATDRLRPGRQAPELFGRAFPGLAARYRRSVAQLRDLVARDPDLWVDDQAKLVYSCAELQAPAAPSRGGESAEGSRAAPFPLETTFQLHSHPSSPRKIYLDFGGHVTSGTLWNDDFTHGKNIVSAPFDQDGDPHSFGAGELGAIQRIWMRVSEDYAPFDLDVTTDDPGVDGLRMSSSSDTHFGVRVVVSPTDGWHPNVGGVAYVGAFQMEITRDDVPCFVFTSNLGNKEENIAEACAHEAGHTLGLTHDGKVGGTEYYTGQGDWAPIMGASYSKDVTQWSAGEYRGANNQEDDLAVIQSFGGLLRPDDYPNSPSGAPKLTNGVPVQGVIETRTDQDFFRLDSTGGAVTITADPAPLGPDLNIRLDIYDAAGHPVQSADPPGLSASFTTTLPAGTYFVSVDGAGEGDPLTNGYSDYASLGQYTITATFNGPKPLALTSPNGGEAWTEGSTHALTWTGGTTAHVKLEYSADSGVSWSLITPDTPNTGSQNWTAPTAPTNRARIRISSVDSGSDSSDADFTVSTTPAVQVTSPNGGEAWTAGSTHNITWSGGVPADHVRLEYFDGTNWSTISDSTANDGSEPWTVPGVSTAQARVRVTFLSGGQPQDQSDDVFTISAAGAAAIRLTSPNGGEAWKVGSVHNITWTGSGKGTVKLEYSVDGKPWQIISAGAANDGSMAWTVPSAPSNRAQVRITGDASGGQDTSDGFFSVTAVAPDSYEDDDSPLTAHAIALGETQRHTIHAAGNEDWVKFVLSAPTRIVATTSGAAGGDTVLDLYAGSDISLLASNDDIKKGSGYSQIDQRLPAGAYYLRVTGKNESLVASYKLSLKKRTAVPSHQGWRRLGF